MADEVERRKEILEATTYHRAGMGTNALKRLGERIADGRKLSDEDHDLYREFIADADYRRSMLQIVLDSFLKESGRISDRYAVTSVGRTKTLSTLREKLIRTPHEKLPSIRDVAGIRIVSDFSMLEQRVLVQSLVATFGVDGPFKWLNLTHEPRVVDRLQEPMHGYRAVHLVLKMDGMPVEIQVRTSLQHGWAALMELLCDRWGREPRYGLPIIENNQALRALKDHVLAQLFKLADEIANLENSTSLYGMSRFKLDWNDVDSKLAEVHETLSDQLKIVEPLIASAHDGVQESLKRLALIVEAVDAVQKEQRS